MMYGILPGHLQELKIGLDIMKNWNSEFYLIYSQLFNENVIFDSKMK